jgi:hypothetical protein
MAAGNGGTGRDARVTNGSDESRCSRARFVHAPVVALGVTLAACAATPSRAGPAKKSPISGDSSTESGAGTALYVRHQLASFSADTANVKLAAAVVGLSNLEVLDVSADDEVTSELVAPPARSDACPGAPIQVAVADVDANGLDDVLVMDTCGNWLALADEDGHYTAVPFEGLLAPLPAWESFEHLHFADGAELLVGGDTWSGAWLGRGSSGVEFGGSAGFALPPPFLGTKVTHTFVALGAEGDRALDPPLLYQGGAALHRLERNGLDLTLGATLVPETIHAPYVRAFDAFDHLQKLELDACPPAALGVGVFTSDVHGIPRALELVLPSATTFDTRELTTTGEIVTFSVVSLGDAALVGAVERSDGAYTFAAYRITACDEFELLAEAPVEFDWRAPPAPSFTNGILPKTDGVKLLGVAVNDGTETYRFYEYDGYDLRIFELSRSEPQGPFTIGTHKVAVHVARDDLAY